MSVIVSGSSGVPYGVKQVCRVWDVSRSTMYWQRQQAKTPRTEPRKRPGPRGACSDNELVAQIKRLIEESPFHGEGYRKMWARLRFARIRTSKERVRRLMREHGLQAPHRVGHPHGPKAHDGSIRTEVPNEMWGTDTTTTVTTKEGQAAVMIAVDHCSFECVGIHAAKSGNRFETLEPIRQGVRERFGRFEEATAQGLSLRHDHGSAYVSDHFQNEIEYLGITSSPAFVREPEGNGCAERFVRILKENLLWVRTFATIEELRLALWEFKERYNTQWILQRWAYRTPREAALDASQRLSAQAA